MEIKNRFHIEIFTYKGFGTLTPLIIKTRAHARENLTGEPTPVRFYHKGFRSECLNLADACAMVYYWI